MFPGADATVYHNEAGEPIGWDTHYEDDPYWYTEEHSWEEDYPYDGWDERDYEYETQWYGYYAELED